MPELPEMQAMAERLDAALAGAVLTGTELLGFSGLKTASPPPGTLAGRALESVSRRGKYAVLTFSGGLRAAVHLSQGGRVDLERPPKATRPRGAVVRFVFEGQALLVREHGTQRKAGWWLLGPGDEGPLAGLGPEPGDEAFAELVRHDTSSRRLSTWLRDQRVVAGIGRGYADDIANRAGLSPFATVGSLDATGRQGLLDAVRAVLSDALESERRRPGALSAARLGDRFAVHGREGQPCPRCGRALHRVSFESSEVTYCTCQTGGKVLADRRLSRLLR